MARINNLFCGYLLGVNINKVRVYHGKITIVYKDILHVLLFENFVGRPFKYKKKPKKEATKLRRHGFVYPIVDGRVYGWQIWEAKEISDKWGNLAFPIVFCHDEKILKVLERIKTLWKSSKGGIKKKVVLDMFFVLNHVGVAILGKSGVDCGDLLVSVIDGEIEVVFKDVMFRLGFTPFIFLRSSGRRREEKFRSAKDLAERLKEIL